MDKIRQLRLMGWTGKVDIPKAYQILSDLDAEYVLVKRVSDCPVEASDLFLEGFESHPKWFQKQEQWEGVAILQVLH